MVRLARDEWPLFYSLIDKNHPENRFLIDKISVFMNNCDSY